MKLSYLIDLLITIGVVSVTIALSACMIFVVYVMYDDHNTIKIFKKTRFFQEQIPISKNIECVDEEWIFKK